MTIFDLHKQTLKDYQEFVSSFINVADERLKEFIQKLLEDEQRLWPEPLVQLSPGYQRDATVEELSQKGLLHQETSEIFRRPNGGTYRLYLHQVEAILKALSGHNFVLTSGTGSGKTFCYFIPIIDTVVRHPELEGPIAFIIYPMNALVNSQLQALKQLEENYKNRTGSSFPVRFAKYTGETEESEREQIRKDPPHIILTNYVMAELILTRPEDRSFIRPRPDLKGPFFLVFDELHTYRGRQGADVAMLVRRLKARLNCPQIVHIGTSATLVAHKEASPEERKKVVAEFASRFFGASIDQDDVIEETLEPMTEGGKPQDQELRQAMFEPIPIDFDKLRRHPLARWLEHTLGIEKEQDGRYRRRVPRPLSDVAKELSEITRLPLENCQSKLEELLIHAAELNQNLEEPFFAFKLHQFISQGRPVYATLEQPKDREFSAEGQIVEERPFYPLRFCRICGQDYYHVLRSNGKILPHPIGNDELEEDVEAGYLTFIDWSEDKIPEDWRDDNGKITQTWRSRVPQAIWVRKDGTFSTDPIDGAVKAWWQPRKFWLCLNCGEYYTEKEAEFTKLSHLSSEGRSSATTVLATAVLRHAKRSNAIQDKLLTFTDSRQDASLQAGHFNDFIQMAVLRSALYAALKENGELHFDNVAEETVKHMGLDLRDIVNSSYKALDPNSFSGKQALQTFKDLIEYRLYSDLRRGWRVLQPNLEDVGLLRVDYDGLENICLNDYLWRDVPVLNEKEPAERKSIAQFVLDHFRKRFAIEAQILNRNFQQQLIKRAQHYLNDFWGIDPNGEFLRESSCFIRTIKKGQLLRNVTFYRLSPLSLLGKFLIDELKLQDLDEFLDRFLELLVTQGFLRRQLIANAHESYRLDASRLVWKIGNNDSPQPDLIYTRRNSKIEGPVSINQFYKKLYMAAARELASFEAREHTAQVVTPGERERRERRFRWLPEDQRDPELGRRLPYLVCSPTMELGIDIADLDVVHMRNVPPSPANYAQRSGRAGRQGQPGFIITFCSANSNHDQYFFLNRADLVAGAVRAPRIDLTNEAMIRAHVQAEWLAEVGLPLHKSIEDVIDTNQLPDLPLRENAAAQIKISAEVRARLLQRLWKIIKNDLDLLKESGWFDERWLENIVDDAPNKFNESFSRWRELFVIAKEQYDLATQQIFSARTKQEQDRAQQLQNEAKRQRNLLVQTGVAKEEGDFYPYRYLATEGFLPGYNFPALPVRAWVPRHEGEYIPRPRSLAIKEFAPHNIVYHEGAKWQVQKFESPPGGLAQRYKQRKLCQECGAFTEDSHDRCPVCNTLFDGSNSEIISFLELPNVRLSRKERITCNEEERIHIGYEIQIAYQFSPTESGNRILEADVKANEELLSTLIYAPSATILHINRGWKGKPKGFFIDLDSGELFTDNEIEDQDNNEVPFAIQNYRTRQIKRLSLCVWETQNILIMRLPYSKIKISTKTEVSLLYALKRGIEQVFELEERELGVQRLGRGDHRILLFYEAAEGGLGVLRRLVEDNDALATVAKEALRICHYDKNGNDQKKDCIQACYECLLSYTNQSEALLLDRKQIRDLLLQFSNCQVSRRFKGKNREQQFQFLVDQTQSDFERNFIRFLYERNYRLPDDAQKSILEPRCIADFFYEPNVLVFCDGPAHDHPDQRRIDERIRRELLARGYRVVVLHWRDSFESIVSKYPEIFK